MSILSLFLVALSLATDAVAISVSNGIAAHNQQHKMRQGLIVAGAFGGAQALMLLLGYFLGHRFGSFISAIDHWVAFILLALIGGKMLIDGLRAWYKKDPSPAALMLSPRLLLGQTIATSIDAFAVGVSFAVINVDIALATLIVGTVTFVCCLLGFGVGRFFGRFLQNIATIIGGLVLIGIGLHILLGGLSA
jgi:putative Mn2+ efflux pump MntP